MPVSCPVCTGNIFLADGLVEELQVLLQASFTLLCFNVPRQDQIHEGPFYEDMHNETKKHAEDEVEGQEVEHGVIRQEQGLVE